MTFSNIDWLFWLYVYLGIGAATALFFYLSSLKDRPTKFVRDIRFALGLGKTLKDYLQDIFVYFVSLAVIFVGWPGFLVWAAIKKREDRMRELQEDEPTFICKAEFLVRTVSPLEAEQKNQVHDPLGLVPKVPFGHLNRAWGKFLSEFGFEDGNELWYFEVPKGESSGEYNMFDGPISGYAKVVKGKVCGEFVTEGG
jgi:hypothetical protein